MVVITENDWRLFKEKLPYWQERHMEKLNRKYIEILSGVGLASEKFWKLEKQINQDKQKAGVIIEMKRSNVFPCIVDLLKLRIITKKDLEGFSNDFIAAVTYIYG